VTGAYFLCKREAAAVIWHHNSRFYSSILACEKTKVNQKMLSQNLPKDTIPFLQFLHSFLTNSIVKAVILLPWEAGPQPLTQVT
jgi:hypothetical protein